MSKRYDLIFIIGTILSILTVVLLKRPIIFGILLSLIILLIISLKLNYNVNELIKISIKSNRSVIFVLVMLSFIGMMIPMWMASGTLPTLIIYGLKYLGNSNILLATFISTAFVSLILGTGIGTVGTMGLVFLGLSYGLDIPKPLIVGAIVSGSYIGDRTSPLSSMANLSSKICETNIIDNFKEMLKTLLPVFIVTSLIYSIIGSKYLATESSTIELNHIVNLLNQNFTTGFLLLIPPLLIIFSAIILKKSIVFSIGTSLLSSIFISLLITKMSLSKILTIMIFGFHPVNSEISNILSGSGLLSMVIVLLVIITSTSINAILTHTNLLEKTLITFSSNIKSYSNLIQKTALLSSLITIVTCNQIMTTLITGTHFKKVFNKYKIKRNRLMLTIADTGIILVPIIPWNLNAIIVYSITGVSATLYAPYAFLAYLLPLLTFIYPVFLNKKYLSNFKE
ncbi:Na+/H+ antiporter NhaC family protein [Helicovermis profundi]|uniref:Na+/H+ antiporter NhaC n=1 Tax=Helicovermis profundi TaxID=3065157 RepID=A0AAU9EKY3_9FIRM|nr:Na+/H+ antiporter NhaC [Clostridia bacterium S502]